MNRTLVAIGALFIMVGVALLPLYPYSLDRVHYQAYGGYSDIQVFQLSPDLFVSLGFHVYAASALFSLQLPDGSYLLHDQNISSLFYYSFQVVQEGYYTLNFSAPGAPYSYGFDAAANITFYQPLFGKHILSAGSCTLRLPSSPSTVPSKFGCTGEMGRITPGCGVCP